MNAGASVTYDVTITNTGNVNDTYALSSTSSWGISFSQSTISIPWGYNNSRTVQVTIKTPTNAEVSHSPIVIVATSTNGTAASGTVSLNLGIVPKYSVSMTLSSAELTNATSYVYPIAVQNTGNIEDTYNVTITNAKELAAAGWNIVFSDGNTYQNVTVGAESSQTVDALLTKNSTQTPNTNVSVSLNATSANASAQASIALQKIDLQVPSGGLSVSGGGISMTAPQISVGTYITAALVVLMVVLLIYLTMNRGVFGRRRKRSIALVVLSLLLISSTAALVSASSPPSYVVSLNGDNQYLGLGQTGIFNVSVSSGAGKGVTYTYTAVVSNNASVTPSTGQTSNGTFSVSVVAPTTAQDISLWVNVTASTSSGYSNGSAEYTIHVINPIVLTATIKNTANVVAYDVPIQFWVDGNLVNSTTFTAPANGEEVVTYNWTNPNISNGEHTLVVKLDPNDKFVQMANGGYTSSSNFYVGDSGLGLLSLLLTIILVILVVVVVLTWMNRGRKKRRR